jgi:hypothetical protein
VSAIVAEEADDSISFLDLVVGEVISVEQRHTATLEAKVLGRNTRHGYKTR